MIKVEWLRNAMYSKEYVTDGILFIDRTKIIVPDGYKPLNISVNKIKELFELPIIEQINTNYNIQRTYAKRTIVRYSVRDKYVILNNEYNYLWKNNYLFTLQSFNSRQYLGPVGIVNDKGLFAIISPLQIEDKNLENPSYWVNVDKLLLK